MSKALFICYRDKKIPDNLIKRIEFIQRNILPDNIIPNELDLVVGDGIISCIINPVTLEQRNDTSICLGTTDAKLWWKRTSGNGVLEGSYAIFREDKNYIELQTDAVSSRTIWYFCDEEKIIASNSQLAIIYFLGNFQFNQEVVPWMLSNGILGPYLSWDKRIQFLKPQSKLSLSKESWQINIENEPIDFSYSIENDLKNDQYLEKLSSAIEKSILSLPLDKNLLMPLSGGYDSRGILLSIEKKENLRTITWGSKVAIENKKNDAYIAQKLSEHFNTNHSYVHSEDSTQKAETIIERFLTNSEGRIDHIAGYMDGFDIWKNIFENKYAAIIRGDEGFGWTMSFSEKQARSSVGLSLVEDFSKLKELDFSNSLPVEFEKNINESIEQWRDRLFHIFNLPIISGALNETKSSYVEILNPLLSYSILKFVRTLPDRMRTDKKLFKTFVESKTPNIPFATEGANIDYRDQLKNKDMVKYFISTLENSNQSIIKMTFIEKLIMDIKKNKKENTQSTASKVIKRYSPKFIKLFLKSKIKNLNTLNDNLLLFRCFIVVRMNQKINNTLNKVTNEISNS